MSVYWGNQSFWPDILFEARPIPGSHRVMFSGVGHHDIFSGSIGIIDRNQGLNYPHGLTKVTPDVPWGEVGDGPAEQPESDQYDTSGNYTAYRSPYPLSDRLFLVSARRGTKHTHIASDRDAGYFKLYLMDLQGNRELIYEGAYNVLYAMPVKPRARPPLIPDRVAWPGRERDGQPVAPGVLFSGDVYAGLPRCSSRDSQVPASHSAGLHHVFPGLQGPAAGRHADTAADARRAAVVADGRRRHQTDPGQRADRGGRFGVPGSATVPGAAFPAPG